mgnify:CR=1 FL=1
MTTSSTRRPLASCLTPSPRPWRRRSSLLTALAALMLASSAFAEGSAEVNVPNDQHAQAAENVAVGAATLRLGRLGVDILAAGERIGWTGTGSLAVWAPGLNPDAAAATTTLASGASFATTAAGEWTIEMGSDQTGAWDISVTGAAAGYGRLFSRGWYFVTGGRTAAEATNASFFALVPGGTPERSGVMELRLDGMSGNRYFIAANRRGVDGTAAGRSVPAAGNSVTPEYKIYLNPPEASTFDPMAPELSLLTFNGGDAACQAVELGVAPGTFQFTSNIAGTYHLVCDTNTDGTFDRVSRTDFSSVNLAAAGVNSVTWDGTDDTGTAVAPGTYECRVFLNTGEMHYVAWDIETAYQGLRMFGVTETGPGTFARAGLDMFWDDSDPGLVAAADLPGAEDAFPLETSGALGRNAGAYGDAADVCTAASSAVCNARGWGNYATGNGVSEGDDGLLDTYAYLNTVSSQVITVEAVAVTHSDADSFSDFTEECVIGTDPNNVDTDGDGLDDDVEDDGTGVDTDGDGVNDALDADSDGDGVTDAMEGSDDVDGDGVANALDLDSDGDGILDVVEAGVGDLDANGDGRIDDLTDADGDGLAARVDADDDDASVVTSTAPDPNTDGEDGVDRLDLDSDGDGIPDVVEAGGEDDGEGHHAGSGVDADGDGIDDAIDVTEGGTALPVPNSDGADDGADYADADSDNDGVTDDADSDRFDPNVCGDADGDTCEDCSSGTFDLLADGVDTDGDGTCDAAEIDGDGDGVTAGDDSDDADPTVCADTDGDSCDDCSSGTFAPDADGTDADADGLCSARDPHDADADADEDGVRDGDEPSPFADTDGDGLINVLDPDSDDDGLLDGTELGTDCLDEATDPAVCVPDADPDTTTDPLSRDTDGGGVTDTNEDPNLNGAVDDGEGDPLAASDDAGQTIADGDEDGLSDAAEATLGTNPDDADSDDDGTLDGEERNPSLDTDGDGLRNGRDPDSDDDGLLDGLEEGTDCAAIGTESPPCRVDADPDSTTSPLLVDTDAGGISDGIEDSNRNGAVDDGETDPNDPIDDVPCAGDADCGAADDGVVCDTDAGVCVVGCRGSGSPADCPAGETCTSTDASLGLCEVAGGGGAGGAGGVPAAGAAGAPGGAAGTPAATGGISAAAGAAGEAALGGGAGEAATGGAAGEAATGGAAGEPSAAGAAGGPQTGGATTTTGGASTGGTVVPATGSGGLSLEGGGCDCATPRRAASVAWLWLALPALVLGRRRRRR